MAILEYLLGHESDNQNNAQCESLGPVPSVLQVTMAMQWSVLPHSYTHYVSGPLGPCHGPRPWLVSAVTPQWREPDKCPIIFTAVTSIWYESILSRIECVSNQMGNCRSSCPHLASGKYLLLSTSQYLCGQFKLIATNLLHATFHSLLKVKHRTQEPNLSMLEQNRII